MIETKEKLAILENFHKKCVENNIWYSIFGSSLLKYKKNEEFNDDLIEVIMTIDDYYKLVSISPKNIIDSFTKSNYFFSNPFYVEKNSNVSIKINLLIKAEINKTEKIYSIKNLIRQNIGFYKTCGKFVKGFKENMNNIYYRFLNLFFSPLTWQEISSSIYNEKQNGFFVIDSFSENINKNWIPSLSFKNNEINFYGINSFVFEESNTFLSKRYGLSWETNPSITKKQKNFFLITNNFS